MAPMVLFLLPHLFFFFSPLRFATYLGTLTLSPHNRSLAGFEGQAAARISWLSPETRTTPRPALGRGAFPGDPKGAGHRARPALHCGIPH